MATSLLTQLMNGFQGEALNGIASALGESSSRTQTALGAVVPALIAGLDNRTSSPERATELIDVISRHRLDTATFADASNAMRGPGGLTSLINMGRPLLDSLFGPRAGSITDWVTSLSGISRSSSSSLLSLAVPLLLGQIARRLRANGMNPANLMSLLAEQRSSLGNAPAGLEAALGVDERIERHAETHEGARYVGSYESEARRAPAVTAHAPEHRERNPWLWALPLLFLIPLLGYFMTRDAPRRVAQDRTVPQAAMPRERAPEVPRAVGTSGEPATAPRVVGPYRIEFQTGSSDLTTASAARLREAADALKANPQATADVNGYTDNTGNDAANMRLSQARAEETADRLEGLGIDDSRLKAHGYGEANPVADNGTADGRQRNRRVEINVTNK